MIIAFVPIKDNSLRKENKKNDRDGESTRTKPKDIAEKRDAQRPSFKGGGWNIKNGHI